MSESSPTSPPEQPPSSDRWLDDSVFFRQWSQRLNASLLSLIDSTEFAQPMGSIREDDEANQEAAKTGRSSSEQLPQAQLTDSEFTARLDMLFKELDAEKSLEA